MNNTGYQATIDLRPETVGTDPKQFPPTSEGIRSTTCRRRLHPNPKTMLVVGAGSGNDAAGALRNGASGSSQSKSIRGSSRYGRRFHPEKPVRRTRGMRGGKRRRP